MNNRLKLLIQSLNNRIGLFVSISFGIFLFILFFQPFTITRFDFNNRLLFVAGFGAIVFLILLMVTSSMLWFIYKNPERENGKNISSYLSGFIVIILCSVAFAFYLRYVGSVGITFYIMFKVVLICIIPPVVLSIYEKNRSFIHQIKTLVSERKLVQKRIEKYEEDTLSKSIEFITETGNENLTLLAAEVVLIQSADNYVEVAYMDGENIRRKLIRNTLKNVELQVKPYSNFIRCHRTCIVNLHYVEKLNRDYGNHWLKLKRYTEKIPVSRQYLLKVKEAL